MASTGWYRLAVRRVNLCSASLTGAESLWEETLRQGSPLDALTIQLTGGAAVVHDF